MADELSISTLNAQDRSLIEELCYQLTGARPGTDARLENCLVNLTRRMRQQNSTSLRQYLSIARDSEGEIAELISALTIHTTSWFREKAHFDQLEVIARQYAQSDKSRQAFRILSAACSTGEEVYTMGLVLESIRERFPAFDYAIEGWDIDPVSISKAQRAVYDQAGLEQIPSLYQRFSLRGQGPSAGLFTLTKAIRQRCRFQRHALETASAASQSRFDVIFCRNVLIYFKGADIEKVIHHLLDVLSPSGRLFLGHSESIEAARYGLQSLGHAAYRRLPSLDQPKVASRQTDPARATLQKRLLVIDDSAVVKMALQKALARHGHQVHFASSLSEASSYLKKKRYDQALINLALASKDHHRWAEDQKRRGSLSSVVVMGQSSGQEARSALGALEHGAEEFIDKRKILSDPDRMAQYLLNLLDRGQISQRSLAQPKVPENLVLRLPHILLIGASTGGTEALLRMMKEMPRPCPPVLVVQHIATAFARPFAERLAEVARLELGKPVSGTEVRPNHLYMAWDDYHIGLKRRGGLLQLDISSAPQQHSVRPAVDFLFRSALALPHPNHIMSILLTGMGKDGARGMLELKNAGAMTLTQDEASSVVYGMPGEAVNLGASSFSGTLEQIRQQINQALNLSEAKPAPASHLLKISS